MTNANSKKFSTLLVLLACMLGLLTNASAFLPTTNTRVKVGFYPSESARRLFEDDDTSALNTLAQFGPIPFFAKLNDPEKYWSAVEDFERREGMSKVVAVRNVDAYFADPIGYALAKDRAENNGEINEYSKGYSGKTGVQKRPVFSLFMLLLTTWFFLIFIPGRVSELGVHPSATSGGLCIPSNTLVEDACNNGYKYL